VLAGDDAVAGTDYGGAWSAQVNGERLIVKFRLTRSDGEWERQWTYTDPGGSVLNAIAAGTPSRRDHPARRRSQRVRS